MKITPIKRFWKVLRHYKNEVRQIYAYALLIGIVNLSLPLGLQAIINFLQAGEFTVTWVILVSFVLVGIAITGILQVLQLRVVENIQQDLFTRSAFEFAFRLPKIALLQLDKVHAPELVNRFFDTLIIQKGLPKILIEFSLAVFQIIFGLILMAIYSPYFILLGLALFIILWIIFKITGPKGLATSLKESKYKYLLAHWLEEVARLNRSFKIISKDKFHLHKTDDIAKGYLISRENHFQVLIGQFRLFVVFKVIVAAGLLLLGGYLVLQEQMNIGQFVAAEIIFILIINSVEKVLTTTDTIYDVLTSLDKIGNVTDLALDKNNGISDLIAEKGLSINAKEITFGFPNEQVKQVKKLSFEANANEKIVLEGESGSGKSLLLQILAGMYEIEEGELYINDIPYTSYNRENLNENVGVAFAVNQIFEGTIKDNILFGRNIDEKRITEVLNILDLHSYIMRQPKGIESSVDSGGKSLPRSIIQKLLIARVIIDYPKLLLLEDPLQFVQIEEKKRIIDYIMHPEQNWTVIVVSDFYYWKEKCNRVISLRKN
jgi:ABC-type bacteriocin/lantibiotic exporter with double-glycine peptidase domain